MATFDARTANTDASPGPEVPEDERPVGWRKKVPKKKLTLVESLNLAAKGLALVPGARCRVHGLRGARRYNGRVGTVLAAREVARAPQELAGAAATTASSKELLRYDVELEPVGERDEEVKFDCEADDDGVFDLAEAADDVLDMDDEEKALVARAKRKLLKVKLANLSALMLKVGPEPGPYGSASKVTDEMKRFAEECIAEPTSLARFLKRPELPALRASGDLRWRAFVDGVRDVGIVGVGPHAQCHAIMGTVAAICRKMRDDPYRPPPPRKEGRAFARDTAETRTPATAGLFSKEATRLAREKRDAKRAAAPPRRGGRGARAAYAAADARELEADRAAADDAAAAAAAALDRPASKAGAA
ncbi:hypothetical protein JL720_5829 [Aureococcus anophagefferens]|nr:hypothetical protein JL720_5829 [Aureococcus anophagefferens]